MTDYIILRGVNDNGWVYEKKISARSARAAVRAHLDGTTESVGRFVAVPARSWQPVTVDVVTKTQLKFQ